MFQSYMIIVRLVTREKISNQSRLGLRPQCFTYAVYGMYTCQVG